MLSNQKHTLLHSDTPLKAPLPRATFALALNAALCVQGTLDSTTLWLLAALRGLASLEFRGQGRDSRSSGLAVV